MFFPGGDPFQHRGGGGRRGGYGRGRPPAAAADTTKLYQVLGVPKSASPAEIKKAYRKLAVQHHPDKGGDEHFFKEINAAYEILSDEPKRAKYDQYGLEGIDDDGHGHDAEDLFSMFFGGGGGPRRSSAGQPRRGEDTNHPIKVSLEELYNGKTVKLAIARQVIHGGTRECEACDGQGVVIQLRHIGLGMVQQVQRHCPECEGEGHIYNTKRERKVVEVHVEKGMKHNQKIVFRGYGDEKPNMEPGNINFIVQEKDHDLFKRKGADLLITKRLSLNQALTGFEWKVPHLDGREVIIKSKPGEVIKPEQDARTPFVKMVPQEGMPSLGNPFVRGNLYVVFQVDFPEDNELSPEAIAALKQHLPGAAMPIDYDEDTAEVVHLDAADVKQFGKGGAASHNSAYDSDESDDGPQAVNCQPS